MDTHPPLLLELILAINPDILQLGKIVEMNWSVNAVIESDWRVQPDVHRLLLDRSKRASHEAVVPDAVVGHKEVATDLIGQ